MGKDSKVAKDLAVGPKDSKVAEDLVVGPKVSKVADTLASVVVVNIAFDRVGR